MSICGDTDEEKGQGIRKEKREGERRNGGRKGEGTTESEQL